MSEIVIDLERVNQAYVSGCDLWTWQWATDGHDAPVVRMASNQEARITDNTIVGNASGIEVTRAQKTYISGNAIGARNEADGIRMAHSKNTAIVGNQL